MNTPPHSQTANESISHHLAEAEKLLPSDVSKAEQQALMAYELATRANAPQAQMEACYLLGKLYYSTGDQEQALTQFMRVVELSQENTLHKLAAASYNNIGLIQFNRANWEEAIQAYRQSLYLKNESGDKKGAAISLLNMGGVYFQKGIYPNALQNYLEAGKVFEELGEELLKAKAIYNAGLVYAIDKQYQPAIEHYLRALAISERQNDKISVIDIYNNLGDSYRESNDFLNAEKYLLACLDLSVKEKYKVGEVAALANLCELRIAEANYTDCEAYCKKIIALNYSENTNALILAHLNLGRCRFAHGQYKEAEEELYASYHLAKSVESSYHLSCILENLIHLFEHIGDFKSAFENQKEYQFLKDELYDSRIDRKLAEVQFQHDLETKQKEAEIERIRNVELKSEKEKSDTLLRNILPDEVADELKSTGKATPRLFENVTVLFTDFVSFSKVSERLSPEQLVTELDTCFKAFDEIIAKYNIEKIKTIGDAYLAVSGLPTENPNHALDITRAAFEIRDFIAERKQDLGDNAFQIRIGIHSGSVVAGIVGVKKFAYDIWGDTVNTAARMEQNSVAGKVNISHATYELVKDQFTCAYRGEIEAKNKGKLKMYFVE